MADKPLNLTATGGEPAAGQQGSYVYTDLAWTNNDAYTKIQVDCNSGSGYVTLTDTLDGTRTWYDHLQNDFNVTLTYRVRGYVGAWSDWSDTTTIEHYLDESTETITGSEVVVDDTAGTTSDTVTETITITDTATDGSAYGQINSETITITDTLEDSVLITINTAHYVGTSVGNVYRYGADYLSDAGSTIRSFWKSKKIDFFDQYPQFLDAWKTLWRVKLIYVDKTANTTVNLYVSTDGGTTMTVKSKTLGTGDGITKEAYFWFIKTGRYFNFWIEHVSTTNAFQWLSLEAEFTPAGDFFPMS